MKHSLKSILAAGMLLTTTLVFTSCEGALDDIFGEWSRPTPTEAPTEGSTPAPLILDLSTVTEAITIQDGYTLTGTLDVANYPVKISIADGATVTFDGVTIIGVNNDGCKWAGITCEGDATIILKEGTANTVKGFHKYYPCILAAVYKTLTIKGTGMLNVSNDGWGAGIGGGHMIACGNIDIQGGTITAKGGGNSAGIGSGSYTGASCGNITISDGDITATGGDGATGIGSGKDPGAICGNIIILGGKVEAHGGSDAAGIGSGKNHAICGNITISDGDITATGANGSAGIGSGNFNSQCGNIIISGGTIMATGGLHAPGIGCGGFAGYPSQCGAITITADVTSVTAIRDGSANYSIGTGPDGSCSMVKFGSLTMYDGTNWTTTPTNGNAYDGLNLAIFTTTNSNDTWKLVP